MAADRWDHSVLSAPTPRRVDFRGVYGQLVRVREQVPCSCAHPRWQHRSETDASADGCSMRTCGCVAFWDPEWGAE